MQGLGRSPVNPDAKAYNLVGSKQTLLQYTHAENNTNMDLYLKVLDAKKIDALFDLVDVSGLNF